MNRVAQEKVFEVDVLILGAGISGLSAGYELSKKKKLRFAILEGRDRIGGRIWSEILPSGLVLEHGAEWIGVTHKHIRMICKKLNITLEHHVFLASPYVKDGVAISPLVLGDIFKKLDRVLSNKKNFKKLEGMSLLRFFKEHFSADEVAILRTIYSAEFGDDVRYVSAYREAMDHAHGGKNTHMDFHVRGGNTRLINAMAEVVGDDRIYLRNEVTEIMQHREGVIVRSANGSEWRAKKVICTLPTQALSRVRFTPAIPASMKSAMQNLRYGNIVKVMLVFPERFWVKEDFSFFANDVAQYVFHATQGQAGVPGVLCMYAVGAHADALKHMNLAQTWKALKTILPTSIDTKGIKPLERKVHSWEGDRFVSGAYAVYQPNEWSRVQSAFGKPYKHMYFAGEHLGEMQGFMEGAVATGVGAAKEITQLLK